MPNMRRNSKERGFSRTKAVHILIFIVLRKKGPVGTAIASFIIGIISLVLCNTVIGPIVGLILGIVGTKQYNPARNTSKWMGVWGKY